MKTWHVELGTVAAVLLTVTSLAWTRPADWLACFAVLCSFAHGQISDRMAEAQEARATPEVHCYRLSVRYWLIKEALWISFFIAMRSYAAIIGSALFALYPYWRKWWRRMHPRAA